MSEIREINLNMITIAMEGGRPLYLTGRFGGFGGCLFETKMKRVQNSMILIGHLAPSKAVSDE